jgi:ABC-type Fe3+ transport system permease subunit
VRRRQSSGRPGRTDSAPWWGNAAGAVVAVLFVLTVLSPFAYFLVPGFVNGKSLADSITRKSGQGSELASSTCKRVARDSDTWDCPVLAPDSV